VLHTQPAGVTKTNGVGLLDLVWGRTFGVNSNRNYILRLPYRTEDASLANLLLLRATLDTNEVPKLDATIDGFAMWTGQSLMRNSPPGQCVGNFTAEATLVDPPGSGKWWYPSWRSEVWRADLERVFSRIAAHLKESACGKSHYAPGPTPDSREFRERDPWAVRERLAAAVKRAIARPVIVLAYAAPCYHALVDCPHRDGVGMQPDYAQRRNGFPIAFNSVCADDMGDRLLFTELGLRSHTGEAWPDSEVFRQWTSVPKTAEEWRHIHRKITGFSRAKPCASTCPACSRSAATRRCISPSSFGARRACNRFGSVPPLPTPWRALGGPPARLGATAHQRPTAAPGRPARASLLAGFGFLAQGLASGDGSP
jgi:hypothetical protein